MSAQPDRIGYQQESSAHQFCSICGNSGWQRLRRTDGTLAVRRCPQVLHLEERLTALGIPPRYLSFTLASYLTDSNFATINQSASTTNAKQMIEQYSRSFAHTGSGLIISGNKASGKTHLAVGLMRLLLTESLAKPRFIDAGEVFYELNSEMALLPEEARRITLTSLIESDLLIIDDLNRISGDEQHELLEYVVGYRYRHLLPLVITTRLSWPEIRLTFGNSISSRLAEMCEVISI